MERPVTQPIDWPAGLPGCIARIQSTTNGRIIAQSAAGGIWGAGAGLFRTERTTEVIIKVNLFDTTYTPRPSRFVEYAHDLMTFDGVTIFVDEWAIHPAVGTVQTGAKVAWLRVPKCQAPELYRRFDPGQFDLVLSCTDSIPGAVYCPASGVSVDTIGIAPKSRLCCALGNDWGETTAGFDVVRQPRLTQDFAFCLVGESCWQNGYFTERLLDCFALGTVPIYWGCPDIYRWFDTDGILQFDTSDRLYKLLAGRVTFAEYRRLTIAVQNNLMIVQDFASVDDWLYENVLRGYDV